MRKLPPFPEISANFKTVETQLSKRDELINGGLEVDLIHHEEGNNKKDVGEHGKNA